MAVVATGFFDGVHLGHRQVIQTLVSSARERGEEAIVITFSRHPRTVLQQDARELRLLNSPEEKVALLRALGVDRVETLVFDRSFARLTAEEYLRTVLLGRFGATLLVLGYDNRLGSDRLTAVDLGPITQKLGMELIVADVRSVPPDPISSTRIRKALEIGDIAAANQMLGYGYALEGVVVAGNRLGRTIGFPTANMKLYEPLKLIPARGVYAVQVSVLGQTYRGMTNIGLRPTVGGTVPTIETNILDFSEDIYGLPLRITFLRRIRNEVQFPSLEALKAQLVLDRETCRK